MIFIIPLFWFLFVVHRIILYQIQDEVCQPPQGLYAYFDNYFQVIFSSLGPSIVMSILAYLLIKNVRGVVRRRIMPVNDIQSTVNRNSSMINQMDKQLTIMLVSESLITIITYVPYAIELTYINITQDWYKTPLRLAWESVCIETIHLFSYIFFATSFYVSIISNVGFRRKLEGLLGIKKHRQISIVLKNQANATHQPNHFSQQRIQ